jgi:hypothetical protein
MNTTQTTLVLKTVTVVSVKLTTPADRIGRGLVMFAAYPADHLSRGQFPLPPNSAPGSNPGGRQEPAARMRATAEPPAGPAGCLPPVPPSLGRPGSLSTSSDRSWRLAAKRPTRAGAAAVSGRSHWSGSDCQSPDQQTDRRPAARFLSATPTAGK